MGNEMGNNNVTGQQEETTDAFDRNTDCSDYSPSGLNNIDRKQNMNDKENDDTVDVDMPMSLKGPNISSGGDKQVASDQTNSSTKIEGLSGKNKGAVQDHTSTQDDQNITLPEGQDDEPQKNKETETTTISAETIVPVGAMIEDMTSNKVGSSSTSDEEIKLVHETSKRSRESTIADSYSLLEENIEASLEDEEKFCSHEVAVLAGNLVQDTVENLEQRKTGETGVSRVEDQLSQIKGETTSSTESILTDYLDADDSDIKEVVTEGAPRKRGDPSYTRIANDTNQETSKNDSNGILEGNEEICEISTTSTVQILPESGKILDENQIHESENQERGTPKCSATGALGVGEVDSKCQSCFTYPNAIDDRVLVKHELYEREAASGHITDSVRTEEHNAIERTQKEQVKIVDKTIEVQNLSNNFKGDKESDGIHGLVSFSEINGKDFTCLDSSLSGYLPFVSGENVQAEVIEEILVPPKTAISSLQLVEDFDKRVCIKPDSSDSYEENITTTYEEKSIDTKETMNISQFDQPEQILQEEVVKFENSETLSTGIQSVEYTSISEIIFPNGSNKEKENTSANKERENESATAIGFTFQSKQERVTVTVGFTAESNHNEITATAEKTSQEQCLFQTPAPGRGTGEETPLLQRAENMSPFSYSTEQSNKVVEDIPVASIALMQAKDEPEESEKSPLLSPRETSRDFRAPYHSARNKKPLQSLMTEDRACMFSPLNEQESVYKKSTIVSSPRNKGKQKPRSSFFASCMCCSTSTN